ncbi:hypothetical protein SCHPADRAFT_507944 [Schizopora paradoxa]|uniref:Uncharacterized protein n=1 Tax=Schizopora paradoxa TaxID=27342 RepID=A0A0H2S0R4_9AGAM|nr:hypothetical protein SCHPADRAFT_507944 [Schizopora paradoxa]
MSLDALQTPSGVSSIPDQRKYDNLTSYVSLLNPSFLLFVIVLRHFLLPSSFRAQVVDASPISIPNLYSSCNMFSPTSLSFVRYLLFDMPCLVFIRLSVTSFSLDALRCYTYSIPSTPLRYYHSI